MAPTLVESGRWTTAPPPCRRPGAVPASAETADLLRQGPLDPPRAMRILEHADELLAAGDLPRLRPPTSASSASRTDPHRGRAPRPRHGAVPDGPRGGSSPGLGADPRPARDAGDVPRLARARARPGARERSARCRRRPTSRRSVAHRREDRAEIASRLGWLAKETGDHRRANRYFALSRGTTGTPVVHALADRDHLAHLGARLQPRVVAVRAARARQVRRRRRRVLAPVHGRRCSTAGSCT